MTKFYEKFLRPLLTFIAVAWLAIVLFDFFRVTSNFEPMGCIKKETKRYEDGTVDICKGLGYVVYKYERNSLKMTEFGVLYFSKEKQPDPYAEEWIDE